jgi:hypothetical protein
MAVRPAIPTAMLRKFGLLVGAIFVLYGCKPWVTFPGFVPQLVPDAPLRLWALGLGGALMALGAVYPAALRLPYQGWMLIGHALGWVNSRVLLGIVFFVLVTPLGILKRLSGKDGLLRKLDPKAESYRVPRPPGQTSNLSDQF